MSRALRNLLARYDPAFGEQVEGRRRIETLAQGCSIARSMEREGVCGRFRNDPRGARRT